MRVGYNTIVAHHTVAHAPTGPGILRRDADVALVDSLDRSTDGAGEAVQRLKRQLGPARPSRA